MKHPPLMDLRRKVSDAWTRQRILDLLAICEGNWSLAARMAVMERNNFRRLARRVGAL